MIPSGSVGLKAATATAEVAASSREGFLFLWKDLAPKTIILPEKEREMEKETE